MHAISRQSTCPHTSCRLPTWRLLGTSHAVRSHAVRVVVNVAQVRSYSFARDYPYVRWLDYCAVAYFVTRRAAIANMSRVLDWLAKVTPEEAAAKAAALRALRPALTFHDDDDDDDVSRQHEQTAGRASSASTSTGTARGTVPLRDGTGTTQGEQPPQPQQQPQQQPRAADYVFSEACTAARAAAAPAHASAGGGSSGGTRAAKGGGGGRPAGAGLSSGGLSRGDRRPIVPRVSGDMPVAGHLHERCTLA